MYINIRVRYSFCNEDIYLLNDKSRASTKSQFQAFSINFSLFVSAFFLFKSCLVVFLSFISIVFLAIWNIFYKITVIGFRGGESKPIRLILILSFELILALELVFRGVCVLFFFWVNEKLNGLLFLSLLSFSILVVFCLSRIGKLYYYLLSICLSFLDL